MYGLPLQHTVDDVLATERNSVVKSGNDVWRETIDLAGWDIPDSNSPKPSNNTCLLGADVRHDADGSVLDIIETRVRALESAMRFVQLQNETKRVGSSNLGECKRPWRLQSLQIRTPAWTLTSILHRARDGRSLQL